MTVTVTKKKKREKLSVLVKQIANSKRVKIWDIAKVLGVFEAALPSNKYGRLHLFFLQKLKNSTLRECLGHCNRFCKLDEKSSKYNLPGGPINDQANQKNLLERTLLSTLRGMHSFAKHHYSKPISKENKCADRHTYFCCFSIALQIKMFC